MYMSKTLKERVPIMVGKFHDEAGQVVIMTPDRKTFIVSRFDITTPVLCCNICGISALHKIDKQKKEYAECPDHSRHQYEAFYVAMNDTKKYNREARREARKQANHWLNKWLKLVEERATQQEASNNGQRTA